MIGFYDYTVLLTYLSLASGVVGIINAMGGNSLYSIICLLISGLCDMFDGKVARSKKNRTKKERDFGIQLDSLCDIICFGVLPITIGYSIGLNKPIYIIIFVLYLLGALIRLAYFNMLENVRQIKLFNTANKEYVGLPVTAAALIFPFTYIFKSFTGSSFAYIYLIVMFVVAVLFVLKFKIKKPNTKIMLLMLGAGLIELLVILKACHII